MAANLARSARVEYYYCLMESWDGASFGDF
jgi:hypothetical protein